MRENDPNKLFPSLKLLLKGTTEKQATISIIKKTTGKDSTIQRTISIGNNN